MSDHTAIEWTDATWNPVRGCAKVSPGCAHCYAETFAERFRGVKGHPYEQGFDLRLVPEKLGEPQRWKSPKRVFVNSMSDLFQDGVPDEYIAEVWKTMATIRRHTYQVLTKRAARMHEIMPRLVTTFGILPNVWLGVSAENTRQLFERMKYLQRTQAAIRFVSLEPLLEDVSTELRAWLHPRLLHWVIVGGESGQKARPFDLAWARSIVQQCETARVACFVKQLGSDPRGLCSWPYHDKYPPKYLDADGTLASLSGRPGTLCHAVDDGWWPCRLKTKSRKGGDPTEWPADLRVREFPEVAHAV